MKGFLQLVSLQVLFFTRYTQAYSLPRNIPLVERKVSPLFGKVEQLNDEALSKSIRKPLGKQLRRSFFISTSLALATNLGLAFAAPPGFKRIPTQFIAAIADPKASSGNNANEWGLWAVDPGPRGKFQSTKVFESMENSTSAVVINFCHKTPY